MTEILLVQLFNSVSLNANNGIKYVTKTIKIHNLIFPYINMYIVNKIELHNDQCSEIFQPEIVNKHKI